MITKEEKGNKIQSTFILDTDLVSYENYNKLVELYPELNKSEVIRLGLANIDFDNLKEDTKK